MTFQYFHIYKQEVQYHFPNTSKNLKLPTLPPKWTWHWLDVNEKGNTKYCFCQFNSILELCCIIDFKLNAICVLYKIRKASMLAVNDLILGHLSCEYQLGLSNALTFHLQICMFFMYYVRFVGLPIYAKHNRWILITFWMVVNFCSQVICFCFLFYVYSWATCRERNMVNCWGAWRGLEAAVGLYKIKINNKN